MAKCCSSTFGTSKYSFYLLVEKIKDEEDAKRLNFFRYKLRHSFKRKKNYVEMEESMRVYLEAFGDGNYGFDF